MPLLKYWSSLCTISGQLGETVIRRFAANGNLEELTAALARMCDAPIDFVEQAIIEHKPETMLILAKAAKMSWPTTKILLSLRAGQRAASSDEIEQCLASFERLNLGTAQQIIKFYKMRRANGSSKPV